MQIQERDRPIVVLDILESAGKDPGDKDVIDPEESIKALGLLDDVPDGTNVGDVRPAGAVRRVRRMRIFGFGYQPLGICLCE